MAPTKTEPISLPALGYHYSIDLDGVNSGTVTKIDGLGLQVQTEAREEGGNQFHTHTLVKGIKYPNIKLTCNIQGDLNPVLRKWFADMATTVTRKTLTINAYSVLKESQTPVATWTVIEALPVSYTVSGIDSNGTGPITEVYELAHNGFNLSGN